MRVLLVTTWGTACGIAEHSAMLTDAVEQADPSIDMLPDVAALDPAHVDVTEVEVVHLNYHAALHSRWWPEHIAQLRRRVPVVVTYHDSGVPNSDQCKAIVDAADAAVVHEPFDDLPAEKTRYWRMGVPEWTRPPQSLRDDKPLLGTIGFPNAWKNYDALCDITKAAGWDLLLLAPGATVEQVAEWQRRQPEVIVHPEFVERAKAISLLAGCDATAFLYTCAFAGQSGALLLGIAARKPVLALSSCRQFRALYEDTLGHRAIRWYENFDQITFGLELLASIPSTQKRDTHRIRQLAKKESWQRLGAKYAQLYREVAQ